MPKIGLMMGRAGVAVRASTGATLAVVLLLALCGADASGQIVGPLSWQSPVLVEPPQPQSEQHEGLGAISCPSASFCAAIAWPGSIATSTNPTGGAGAWQVAHVDGNTGCESSKCAASLVAISCPTTGLCVGAGHSRLCFLDHRPIERTRELGQRQDQLRIRSQGSVLPVGIAMRGACGGRRSHHFC